MRTIAIVATMLLTSLPAFCRDPNFHIFLCFGQSNMEGFPIEPGEEDMAFADKRFRMLAAVDFPEQERSKGEWYPATPPLCRPSCGLSPADYFGRTMVGNLPNHIKVGVINVSVAGARIEVFDPGKMAAYVETAPNWMKAKIKEYDDNPYQRLVDLGHKAKKAGVIKGILLHQGESNSGDQEWPNKIRIIYDRLLKDLDLEAKDVPLLAGELVSADQGGACASMNEIIHKLPETIPTAHIISSKGCPAHPDHLHFTPAGYRKLGTRYAETMLKLMGKPVANPR